MLSAILRRKGLLLGKEGIWILIGVKRNSLIFITTMDNKFDMRSRSLGGLEVRFFGLVETSGEAARIACQLSLSQAPPLS